MSTISAERTKVTMSLPGFESPLLEICVRAYARHVHPVFPIVHTSTLRSNKQSPVYYAAATIGSMTISSSGIQKRRDRLYQEVRDNLMAVAEAEHELSLQEAFEWLRAGILLRFAALVSADPNFPSGAMESHILLVRWAQRFKLLKMKNRVKVRSHGSLAQHRSAWQTWIQYEEQARTILALYVQDTELTLAHQSQPLLDHRSSVLPQVASDELFATEDVRD